MSHGFSRRDFLKASAAVAGTLAIAGPLIRNKPAYGQTANEKIRYAHVGVGGQAGSHLDLSRNGVCVALCDPDRGRLNGVLESYRNPDPKKNYAKQDPKTYTDYRKMLDEVEKSIDAVVVACPDHHHAPASVRALRAGKHVYTEKPLTWCIEEARMMAELTAQKKVATQMGNMGHANQGNRRIVEWVRAGVLGDILEVHTWTNRPIWPQGGKVNKGKPGPAPANLDWDLWLGPAPTREFLDLGGGKSPVHPFAWRGWIPYGCGAVGDMGCHTWDNVFWSMAPDYPEVVELEQIVDADPTKDCFAKQSKTRWEFPAKGNRKAFKAWWYEGGLKPPVPEEIANDTDRDPKQRGLDGSGSLYIGTKGKMYVQGDYGEPVNLIPIKRMNEFKANEFKTIEKLPPGDHKGEWLKAIRGEQPWDFPKSNFTYGGPLTEVMLLAVIAQKLGQVGFKIECDPVKREIKTKEALALRGREYRTGWGIA